MVFIVLIAFTQVLWVSAKPSQPSPAQPSQAHPAQPNQPSPRPLLPKPQERVRLYARANVLMVRGSPPYGVPTPAATAAHDFGSGGSPTPDPLLRIRFITNKRFIFKSVFKARKTQKSGSQGFQKTNSIPKCIKNDLGDKSTFAIPSRRKPRFGHPKRRNFDSEID